MFVNQVLHGFQLPPQKNFIFLDMPLKTQGIAHTPRTEISFPLKPQSFKSVGWTLTELPSSLSFCTTLFGKTSTSDPVSVLIMTLFPST